MVVAKTVPWAQFEPSGTVGRAITAAVRAAADADVAAYPQSSAELAGVHPMTSGLVLGAVVRRLLEDQHAGGLDGDDIREVLGRCRADTAPWLPPTSVSTAVLIAVVSSALGVHEPGVTYTELLVSEPAATEWVDPDVGGSGIASNAAAGSRPPTDAEYTWHAPLLIASLLRAGGGRLDRYLDAAFAEIARAETVELP